MSRATKTLAAVRELTAVLVVRDAPMARDLRRELENLRRCIVMALRADELARAKVKPPAK
jgi:hypothetical protein